MLSTPFPTLESRLALWAVRHDLSRRLADETLSLDHLGGWSAPADVDDDDDAEAVDRVLSAAAAAPRPALDRPALPRRPRARRRLRRSTPRSAGATASGADADWLAPGARASARPGSTGSRPRSGPRSPATPPSADRAQPGLAPVRRGSRPATRSSPGWKTPPRTPPAALRLGLDAALWAWLADRYQYEGNDLAESDLLNEAARGFRNLSPPRQAASVRFGRVPELPELTPEHPSAELSLDLQVTRPDADNPDVID